MGQTRAISHKDWWTGLVLSALLLALYLPIHRTGAWVGKEGVCLYGSALTVQRKVPYRDYDSFYGPLTTYLHALVFRLGGVNIDTVRLLLVVVLVLNALALYVLARRLLPPLQAAAVSLMGVVFYRFPPHNYVTLYATFFALLSLLTLARSLESTFTPGRGFWVGVGTGLTSVTHHPIAVFLAVSVLGSAALAPRIPQKKGSGYSVRSSLVFLLAFGIGFAGVALPVYGTFASLTSWGALIHQIFPPQIAGEMGRSLPSLSGLVPRSLSGPALYAFAGTAYFWVTFFLVVLMALLLMKEWLRPSGAPVLFLLPLTIFQCLMESKNITLGAPNLLYVQTSFILAGYWGFRWAGGHSGQKSSDDRLSWKKIVIWCVLASWVMLEVGTWATRQFIGRAKPTHRVTTGAGTLYMSPVLGEDTQAVIDFLEKNTAPTDPVAVFPDGTFLSLLSGRPNPFRTTAFDTRLNEVRDTQAQQEMIKTLETGKVPWIVILEWDPGYALRFDPNDVPLVSAYLRKHYSHDSDLGAIKPPLLSFVAHIYRKK